MGVRFAPECGACDDMVCRSNAAPSAVEDIFILIFIFKSALYILQESPAFQISERLAQLVLCVHHNWAVPSYRLLQRFARDQQKTNAFVPRLDHYFIAPIKDDQ